ncbi:hypothetical protein Q7P35_009521 [Cladosporium inversicolor]
MNSNNIKPTSTNRNAISMLSLALSAYTVEIPESAIIVSDWDSLHAESDRFPNSMLMPKYGGNVIEVDRKIMLATTENLTLEIQNVVDNIPAFTAEQEAEYECILDAYKSGVEAIKTKALCSKEDNGGGLLQKRAYQNSELRVFYECPLLNV